MIVVVGEQVHILYQYTMVISLSISIAGKMCPKKFLSVLKGLKLVCFMGIFNGNFRGGAAILGEGGGGGVEGVGETDTFPKGNI